MGGDRRLVHTFPDAPPEVLATLSPRVRHVRVGSGEVVVAPFDAAWVRTTVIADPAGARFTATQFVPENKDLGGS